MECDNSVPNRLERYKNVPFLSGSGLASGESGARRASLGEMRSYYLPFIRWPLLVKSSASPKGHGELRHSHMGCLGHQASPPDIEPGSWQTPTSSDCRGRIVSPLPHEHPPAVEGKGKWNKSVTDFRKRDKIVTYCRSPRWPFDLAHPAFC